MLIWPFVLARFFHFFVFWVLPTTMTMLAGPKAAAFLCVIAFSSGTPLWRLRKRLTCSIAIKILEWVMAPCKMFSHLFSISLNFLLLGHLLDVTVL